MTTSMKQMSYYNILAWTRECKGRVSQTFNSARLGLLSRDKVSYGNFSRVSQFNYQKVLGPNLMSKAIIKCHIHIKVFKVFWLITVRSLKVGYGSLSGPHSVLCCVIRVLCVLLYTCDLRTDDTVIDAPGLSDPSAAHFLAPKARKRRAALKTNTVQDKSDGPQPC